MLERAKSSELAISAKGMTKTFKTRKGSITAVEDLSLQVARGETYGLIGPDGAGKTTKTNGNVTSPIDGVVLERLVAPNEYAAPGSTVMVIASLDSLTLTIYVPENLYGQFFLGQTYPVTVDSFPGQTFSGTVSFISDQAEFTPRNVQTTDSRHTTVYAIKLDLDPSNGMLKPGMPAGTIKRIPPLYVGTASPYPHIAAGIGYFGVLS